MVYLSANVEWAKGTKRKTCEYIHPCLSPSSTQKEQNYENSSPLAGTEGTQIIPRAEQAHHFYWNGLEDAGTDANTIPKGKEAYNARRRPLYMHGALEQEGICYFTAGGRGGRREGERKGMPQQNAEVACSPPVSSTALGGHQRC
ncbi:hypothetical protein AB1N83_005296 [Pleurotus pulmonarius]